MVAVRWTKDTVSRPHLLGLLENQLGGGRLRKLTNRRVDHDAADENCDDIGSQG